MATPIRIRVQDVELDGELGDDECARAVAARLPLSGRLLAWGDEIHFHVPLEVPSSRNTTMEVHPGDLCYWDEGRALCLYFGPTPISSGERPVPPGPVIVVGSVAGAERLRPVRDAATVSVSRADGEAGSSG